jgi:hypothetical protein
MSRRKRSIYFVLSAAIDGVLASKTIEADLLSDAIELFEKEFSVKPQQTFGPFYKKRTRVPMKATKISLSKNSVKEAEYNGWQVNAFLLDDPKDHAYLVFIRRLDNSNTQKPSGHFTVPISELRFL